MNFSPLGCALLYLQNDGMSRNEDEPLGIKSLSHLVFYGVSFGGQPVNPDQQIQRQQEQERQRLQALQDAQPDVRLQPEEASPSLEYATDYVYSGESQNKDLVAKGLVFYKEKVLGILSPSA